MFPKCPYLEVTLATRTEREQMPTGKPTKESRVKMLKYKLTKAYIIGDIFASTMIHSC